MIKNLFMTVYPVPVYEINHDEIIQIYNTLIYSFQVLSRISRETPLKGRIISFIVLRVKPRYSQIDSDT